MFSWLITRSRDDPRPIKSESTSQPEPQIDNDKFLIMVGPEEKEFMVDVAVLIQGNDYFEETFIRTLTESGKRILILPRMEIDVFRAYLQWAYRRKVVVMDPEEARRSRSKSLEQIGLADLWRFAASVNDVALQNATIDAFLETLRVATAPIAPETIVHLWTMVRQDNWLRKIVMYWFSAKHNSAEYLRARQREIPSSFFIDLALFYSAAPMDPRPPEPYLVDRCAFHVHNDAIPPCGSTEQRLQLTQENVGNFETSETDRRRSSGSVTFGRGTPSEIEAANLFG